jgi:hypothetical protein
VRTNFLLVTKFHTNGKTKMLICHIFPCFLGYFSSNIETLKKIATFQLKFGFDSKLLFVFYCLDMVLKLLTIY